MPLYLRKPAKLYWTCGCGLLFRLEWFLFSSLVPWLGVFLCLFIYLFNSWKKCKFSFGQLSKVSNVMVTVGLMLNGLTLLMILTVFLLLVNFCQFLTWKIWFQPILRIFHEKMDPNSADIEFFFSNCQICMLSSRWQSKYRTILFSSTFISSMLWNLAKLFWEWLSLWLHHKILKSSWVQTQWRAGEILGFTWGLRQQLVSRVCCCVIFVVTKFHHFGIEKKVPS